MAASAASGAATRKTPKPVATPLPPRKRSQTGNMWPRTAQEGGEGLDSSRTWEVWAMRSGGEQAAEPDGGAAFEHVDEEGGRAEALAAGAQDVGRADVAAADGANVFMAEEADQEVTVGMEPNR